jgi:hypothetical protein
LYLKRISILAGAAGCARPTLFWALLWGGQRGCLWNRQTAELMNGDKIACRWRRLIHFRRPGRFVSLCVVSHFPPTLHVTFVRFAPASKRGEGEQESPHSMVPRNTRCGRRSQKFRKWP